jgi:hypothetical protein
MFGRVELVVRNAAPVEFREEGFEPFGMFVKNANAWVGSVCFHGFSIFDLRSDFGKIKNPEACLWICIAVRSSGAPVSNHEKSGDGGAEIFRPTNTIESGRCRSARYTSR